MDSCLAIRQPLGNSEKRSFQRVHHLPHAYTLTPPRRNSKPLAASAPPLASMAG
jgi:hypothetical protein